MVQDLQEARRTWTSGWGWFLAAGIAWMIVSVIVFRLDVDSITAVGVVLGVVFLVSGVDEFTLASMRSSWAWAHVILGILFASGALWSFVNPADAFWSLAAAFGLLLIFGGAL